MKISIDLGTSYSSVCTTDNSGNVAFLDIGTGTSYLGTKYSIPSAVYLNDNNKLDVGQAAVNSRAANPSAFTQAFKRHFGEPYPILLKNKSFMPEDLYTEMFIHMKLKFFNVYKDSIDEVYITHPATYTDSQKDKLILAAKKAGFFNCTLVDEPTSAAMYYGNKGFLSDGQILMVYDFGGGTFDVSLLQFKDNKFSQLAVPLGLRQCGGIDIDLLIYNDILSYFPQSELDRINSDSKMKSFFKSKIQEIAVKAKHHLSNSEEFRENIIISYDIDTVEYCLTRSKFNGMIAPLVGETIKICREILSNTSLKESDLSYILLVGGTSRNVLVREMLAKFTSPDKILMAPDMDMAVAQGALYSGFEKEKSYDNMSIDELYQLAKGGSTEAQYHLGMHYETGDEVEKSYSKAFKFYTLSSEFGNIDAAFRLGYLYANGLGTAVNAAKAFELYKTSAEAGNMDSAVALGFCYQNGTGTVVNKTEAFKWYKTSAEAGNTNAAYELAECCRIGYGTAKNDAEAFKYYKIAAEAGNTNAALILGMCYKNAQGTKQNYEEAFKWFSISAQAGNKFAVFNMGECYQYGYGVEKNRDCALKWYRMAVDAGIASASNRINEINLEIELEAYAKAAQNGDAESAYKLGELYFTGQKVKTKNYAEALKWYKEAAELGNGKAAYKLGQCYTSGTGCAANAVEAFKWYELGADLYDTESIQKLRDCYRNGIGTTKDYKSAFEYAMQAARCSDPSGHQAYILAGYYKNGIGTQMSIEHANNWYKIASNRGSLEAKAVLKTQEVTEVVKGIFGKFRNKF